VLIGRGGPGCRRDDGFRDGHDGELTCTRI
jgi:hypothetical protein